ncbi:hypothetical protein EDE04_6516 [Streptomyces sp. 2132.2]|uniref:hypothetical protein n=1 Tax=Streptomyces sp. 2132.2 TaxID=2485161 RepID=UPI000F46237D|nr:hypothetical protein [Streptomyces sp. 2132.2]ROQ99958.1 hypothetical protein EDE04_6516 [Streptomyces sp. 2132.2]
MSEGRGNRSGALRGWLFGAAGPVEARTMAEALGLAEEAPGLQRLRDAEPRQLARIELLHTAAQRAFERRTGEAVCRALEAAVRAGIRESATGPAGRAPGTGTGRLQAEADAASRRLASDAALAGGRGLNTGLAFGIVLSPVVLVLALLAGRFVPPLFGGAIGCPEELVLMDSLVCFAGGAMGAVFSVIIRLRDAYQLIQPAPGRSEPADIPADPVQLARMMRQEGWYRVVVGWFLASSLFLLINGGILTLLTPPAAPGDMCGPAALSPAGHQALIKAWFFWGGVGFLAGLNERWAYGLVRRGGEPPRPADPPAA